MSPDIPMIHKTPNQMMCLGARRERAVNLAKEAVLVHRNLQTVAWSGENMPEGFGSRPVKGDPVEGSQW